MPLGPPSCCDLPWTSDYTTQDPMVVEPRPRPASAALHAMGMDGWTIHHPIMMGLPPLRASSQGSGHFSAGGCKAGTDKGGSNKREERRREREKGNILKKHGPGSRALHVLQSWEPPASVRPTSPAPRPHHGSFWPTVSWGHAAQVRVEGTVLRSARGLVALVP